MIDKLTADTLKKLYTDIDQVFNASDFPGKNLKNTIGRKKP